MLRSKSWIYSSLILVGWLVAAPSSFAQRKGPTSDAPQEVNDEAGLFSKDAVHAANEEIAAIKNAHRKDLLIVTREKGKDNLNEFRQWAEDQAKEHRVEGIYILITRVPKHFEILVGKQTLKSGLFTIGDHQELLKILQENLAKKPDEALRLSVHHVRAGFCRAQDGNGNQDALIAAMNFVKVPKGTFWMGWDSYEKTSKQVEIKQDFELAAYTVTQEQLEAVMGAGSNPSYFSRQGEGKAQVKDISEADLKRFPVENVSWDDVQVFVKKLNEREKGKGWTYRLPKEAEWEYACRGGATTKEECSFDFYFGKGTNDLSSKEANFNGDNPAGKGAKGPNLGRPTNVGSYEPNKLGLHDMHGNVWQWCEDLYHVKASYRVIRGGCWLFGARGCRAGDRAGVTPGNRFHDLGFRLARVPLGK